MGGPHFGARVRVKAGARSPVHCHVLPSGPFTVPDKILPVQVPSKTMSAFAPSSSFGEINIRRPFESSAKGRRRREGRHGFRGNLDGQDFVEIGRAHV